MHVRHACVFVYMQYADRCQSSVRANPLVFIKRKPKQSKTKISIKSRVEALRTTDILVMEVARQQHT